MRARCLSLRRFGLAFAAALSMASTAVLACIIDGRALTVVEDIERARGIFAVRMLQPLSADAAEYEVLRVIRSRGEIEVGARIEAPVIPRGLLLHARRLILLHHATGYWDLRPGGRLESFVESVVALPARRAG